MDKGYKSLLVWVKAHDLVLLVYKTTSRLPREEMFGLTSQFRRSAVSIPANIVEGYARSSKKEFLQFLFISQGSLAETEYYIELSKDLKYITEKEWVLLDANRQEVGKLLHGLIGSIKRKI